MTRGAIVAAMLLCAANASADAGAPHGEPSRTAALVGSTTARQNDTASIHHNPGALATLERPTLTLNAHIGSARQWFARDGEGGLELDRGVNGFGAALGVRLPGPRWLRRVRLGLALHVPFENALRITAPPRRDAPLSVMYGDRAGRTAVTAGLAVELPHGFGVGVGVTLTPSLATPTRVRYDPLRSPDVEDNVVIEIDRELEIAGSVLAGIHYAPLPVLAFGFAFRQAADARAFGPNDTVAGPVFLDATIDFFEFFAPMELAWGVAGQPLPSLSLSADLVWARWSEYVSIHNESPSPAFDDVVELRIGAEWNAVPSFAVRAGWAFLPSPVPPQTGETTFLDSDRHAIGLGVGLDLEELGWARMRIDLHARWHVLAVQDDDKDLASLPDTNPRLAGTQIDNLGYPGFRAGGAFGQVGVTVTVPLTERAP